MRRFFSVFSLILALGSCGIEDYLFLYPVPSGDILRVTNTQAVVPLPALNTDEYYYFTHFTLYYRIYISDISLVNEINTSDDRSKINQTLYSDYLSIEPYTTNDTTISAANIGTLFSGRKYYPLELQGVGINQILGVLSLGNNITISFPQIPGTPPVLNINGQDYALSRSTGNGSFSPVPSDRYFINSSELNRSQNVSSTVNDDVADKSGISGPRYTYAAVYIVVTGSDPNYTPIYSKPTFVSIFRLPDPA